MALTRILKVALIVASNWILLAQSAEGSRHEYEESFRSSYPDTLSESEINAVINDDYARTKIFSSVFQSNPGRPEKVPACVYEPHIYDAAAEVCGNPYESAHCKGSSIYLPVPNATVGLGACACESINEPSCWRRPQALFGYTACYDIAKQGPCNSGETVVPISKFHAECGPDACLHGTPENAINFSERSKMNPVDNPVFNFTYNGKCYSTESQAFCSRDQVVRFVLPYAIPACMSPNVECPKRGAVLAIQASTYRGCEAGTIPNPVTRVCQGNLSFDFD